MIIDLNEVPLRSPHMSYNYHILSRKVFRMTFMVSRTQLILISDHEESSMNKMGWCSMFLVMGV
jgi:hypothetical protein